MKVLVAGGTGFLGRHVVEVLHTRGHRVVVLARGLRPHPDGAVLVACDLAHERPPADAFIDADAIVNVVGIKREEGRETFEAVHVDATRRLVEAAREHGIRRFVHVSVVCSRPDERSGYHDTKWRAERLVAESGLAATILKPGVIYGPGDDMVTHLVKMIRFAPMFPVVGRGGSILQPVDVRDVAEAVVQALDLESAGVRSYDIVGPERMTLNQVVATVASGVRLPVALVPTPMAFQRVAVHAMNALTSRPLSTPSQLRMLAEGLFGDPEPARRELGLSPRPFTADAVARLEGSIPSLFGFSLRLVDRREQRTWLHSHASIWPRAVVLSVLAGLLIAALGSLGDVWTRMAAAYLLLIPVAIGAVRLDWRPLLSPTLRHLGSGVVAAMVLYVCGWLAFSLLSAMPGVAAQLSMVYGWKQIESLWISLPLLALVIVPGEEIVWRAAVTLPLAGRFGPWVGCFAGAFAFGLAHLGMGLGLLVAAGLGAGLFWNLLLVRTRSLVPGLVCHLLWDLAVLFWMPY